MEKIIPFIFVIAFWGFFYIGITFPGTGEVIAFVSVLVLFMYVLFNLKTYLINLVKQSK